MEDKLVKEARQRMDKSVEAFQHELQTIRTGRASPSLLDTIEVEAYGSKMKLNQVGTITAPEPRMLVVQPWDKSQIKAIERAIMESPLDLNPSNDGQVVRIPLPQLTEERRKDLVKMVSKLAEEARVSVRNIRRHIVDDIKKDQKDGTIPEDNAHRLTAEIQKVTDDSIHSIDQTLKSKEEEIMEV